MSRPFRSISRKILLTLLTITLGFLLLLYSFNTLVMQRIRDDFIYNQIEDYISIGWQFNENSHIGIVPFKIDFSTDDYKIIIPERLYKGKNSEKPEIFTAFDDVAKMIVLDRSTLKGKIKENIVTDYFIVRWDDTDSIATIYVSPQKHERIELHEIIILLIVVSLICLVTSSMVAGIITEPIKKLELFSKEIAQKHWETPVPSVNNDEIGLLAESLNSMKLSLKEAEEREHHFLQSTSHDLKTPVMVIKGYAQAILDGVQMESETTPAEIIMNETKQLERKISQLLYLNTIGNTLNNGERDLVRIDRILNSLVNRFKVIRTEICWDLNLDEIEVDGNADTLLIAFENLIDNQLRFAKSAIAIKAYRDDRTYIEIGNDGPGFNVDDPNTLFDIYQKDRQGHFGLGLSIVKQVIDAHGGSIEAKNRDQGVVFTISL